MARWEKTPWLANMMGNILEDIATKNCRMGSCNWLGWCILGLTVRMSELANEPSDAVILGLATLLRITRS
jgi:hypothetical protein